MLTCTLWKNRGMTLLTTLPGLNQVALSLVSCFWLFLAFSYEYALIWRNFEEGEKIWDLGSSRKRWHLSYPAWPGDRSHRFVSLLWSTTFPLDWINFDGHASCWPFLLIILSWITLAPDDNSINASPLSKQIGVLFFACRVNGPAHTRRLPHLFDTDGAKSTFLRV